MRRTPVVEFVQEESSTQDASKSDVRGTGTTDWTARFGLRVQHVRGELQLRQVLTTTLVGLGFQGGEDLGLISLDGGAGGRCEVHTGRGRLRCVDLPLVRGGRREPPVQQAVGAGGTGGAGGAGAQASGARGGHRL